MSPRPGINLVPVTEFDRVNRARTHEGMDPLPRDEALNETLSRAGFTMCYDKPYPWVTVAIPPRIQTADEILALMRPRPVVVTRAHRPLVKPSLDERDRKIREAFAAGATIESLQKDYQMSRSRVRQITNGIRPQRPGT